MNKGLRDRKTVKSQNFLLNDRPATQWPKICQIKLNLDNLEYFLIVFENQK